MSLSVYKIWGFLENFYSAASSRTLRNLSRYRFLCCRTVEEAFPSSWAINFVLWSVCMSNSYTRASSSENPAFSTQPLSALSSCCKVSLRSNSSKSFSVLSVASSAWPSASFAFSV